MLESKKLPAHNSGGRYNDKPTVRAFVEAARPAYRRLRAKFVAFKSWTCEMYNPSWS